MNVHNKPCQVDYWTAPIYCNMR